MVRSAVRMTLVVILLVGLESPIGAESGSLKVTSFPSGAQVLVDGVSTGKLTPMSISLPVGEHLVTVQIPDSGWRADTRTVTIVTGNNDLRVTLLPAVTDGAPGPKGDKGDPGDKGDKGDPGDPGAALNFSPGDFIGCYSGVPGSRGIGACRSGTREFQGGAFGACIGEVLPAFETCNNLDDDCDGLADDGLSCGGACVPAAETCNGVDDDCDGLIDEGSFCGGGAHTIQNIQDGSVTTGSAATLEGVIVTSVAITAAGRELFIQEPQGTSSHPYPLYAGLAVFVPELQALALPDLLALQIGDCINLSGTVSEFQQGAQLVNVTTLTRVAHCGDIAPRVFDAANVCSIATDVDPFAPGDQPGAQAELFEGVLVKLMDLAGAQPDTFGNIRFQTAPPNVCSVLVDWSYFDGPFSPGALMSVTGVLNQRFGAYRLHPRSSAECQGSAPRAPLPSAAPAEPRPCAASPHSDRRRRSIPQGRANLAAWPLCPSLLL